MDPEPILETNQDEVSSPSLPFPGSAAGRLVYGIYIIAMPILAFLGADALQPEWQSGRMGDYAALWLTPAAHWLFLILLAYSIICYLLLMSNPFRYARSFVVRSGVYTGTLLALQYSIITFIIAPDLFNGYYLVIAAVIVPLFLWRAYVRAVRQWGNPKVTLVALFLLVVVYAVVSLLTHNPEGILFVVFFGAILVSPFWSLLLSSRATLWLLRGHESKLTLPRLLGAGAWIGTYALAWRISILKMYELYAALPTSPPDCYIATAAAQGHPRFVHSEQLQLADGKQIAINPQLQRLKCFELTLFVTTPRLHSVLRSVYDLIGPMLVRYMKNPFIADMAYLVLVPFERLSTSALRHLLPEFDALAGTIYTGSQK